VEFLLWLGKEGKAVEGEVLIARGFTL
jgi:hypothetical protein